MIPVTFPSKRDKILNKDSCTVYFLTSISGLTRWVDYIPVQLISTSSTKEATYNVSAYQPINTLPNITSKIRWVDYIPVYIDNSATVPFSTNANGYIPVGMPYTSVTKIFEAKGYNGYAHNFEESFYLNQLSIGTTTVTAVTDPAGFVADTRLGMALGAELVDTINTSAAWTASGTNTVEQDGDAVKITFVDNAAGAVALFSAAAGLSSNLTVGANYKITYEIKVNSGSANAAVVGAATNQGVAVTSTSYITQSFIFNASHATTNNFTFANLSAGEIVWIKNISVRLFEGNHAIQATAGARSTWTNRVNLLTYSEDIENAVWTTSIAGTGVLPVKTKNYAAAPDGTTTAGRVQFSTGVGTGTADQSIIVNQTGLTATTGSTKVGVWLKTNDGSTKTLKLRGGIATTSATDVVIGPVWTYYPAGDTAASGAMYFSLYMRGSEQTSADILFWHPQIEWGTTATRYQRVTTATDFDTAGFPYYLSFLGTDDSLTSATGGGGSAGFFWCGVVQPTGGAGTARRIFADNGTNTGYALTINASNQLLLQAGNGTAYTSRASTATVDVGTKYLLTVFDDGTNLSVQINAAAAETVARPVVVAGTAGFTIGKDNLIASTYLIANLYPSVYWKDTAGTAAERADAQAYCRMMGGL